ncbi:dienelactone hydrolase family protein [Halomarina salina]|uniref:Dienelactone hydrolase family protein n=1 Tax=Halomarina salina TaxID=1872699 RepID=A0ABD5RQQ1_9EURY|nr:alpha/beta hydrolase [Halomarina salina]
MPPTSDTEATGRAFATRFVGDETVDDAVALLTEDGVASVVDSFPDEFADGPMDAEEALLQYRRGLHSQYGEFEAVGGVSVDGDEATVELRFGDGSAHVALGVTDGGVTTLSFTPEYDVPDYVDESAFTERTVTVDAGDVSLDALLAVPDGAGPFPAVLLVHGAGIHDPDGTAGASKILKDVAWGLASEGIATLLYENRLADHDVDDEDRTLDRVVTDDAVAAVEELVATDEVADGSVVVAGHSQGGMCAPRIAARHGDIAGVVVLDGRAESTLDPDDLAFMRYEFEPDGDLSEEQEAQLDEDRETARRIREGEFEDDETLWGRPGTWHRSVLDYDPAATASGLDCPSFVAKTGRADEDLQPELAAWFRREVGKWRDAPLPNGSRVEFYEGLDHFFQSGYAPWSPLGLYFGGNVAPVVAADLAEWVHGVAGR